MAKVILELDEKILARLDEISSARNVSVEDLIRAQAESFAGAHDDIPNPSHRNLMAALDRPDEYYGSARERTHDRGLARAEAYAQNRERMLALIDATDGDLGAQTWHRASLYDG
jgi:hypothetical protein